MKNARRIVLIAIASVALVSCGKKDEKKADGESSAKAQDGKKVDDGKSGDNTAKKVGLDTKGKSLGGEPVKMAGLKFGGEGFEGEFNEALDSWKFEKWEPQKGGGNDNVVTIYVDGWDSDWPADMDGFATKLGTKDFLDFGSSWPKIENKEKFDAGWVITGDWSDGEDTEKAFAVQLTKLRILCRGTVKPSAKDVAASQKEAIEACKAATL